MSLSVIVPTYNETDNIRPLTERLFRATRAAKLETELLVMDDESDGTAETERLVGALAKEGYAVRIHVRRRGEGKGLSSAMLLVVEHGPRDRGDRLGLVLEVGVHTEHSIIFRAREAQQDGAR